MQYLLTEEEFKSLKKEDLNFKRLVDLMDNIYQCNRDVRLQIYSNLTVELVICQQSGQEDEVFTRYEKMIGNHLQS